MSINLSEVGASITQLTATDWHAQFGIYLPGIAPSGGYSLLVRVIHEADQFTPNIPPVTIPVPHVGGPNGLWQVTTALMRDPASHYGTPGRHLYRYQLLNSDLCRKSSVATTSWAEETLATFGKKEFNFREC